MTGIRTRRACDEPGETDGRRVLVDGIWPRGVSKEALAIDGWMKDVAPGDELRRWFDHDPAKRDGFRERYWKELGAAPEAVGRLREILGKGR